MLQIPIVFSPHCLTCRHGANMASPTTIQAVTLSLAVNTVSFLSTSWFCLRVQNILKKSSVHVAITRHHFKHWPNSSQWQWLRARTYLSRIGHCAEKVWPSIKGVFGAAGLHLAPGIDAAAEQTQDVRVSLAASGRLKAFCWLLGYFLVAPFASNDSHVSLTTKWSEHVDLETTTIFSEACFGKWDKNPTWLRGWRKEAALKTDVYQFNELWSFKKKRKINSHDCAWFKNGLSTIGFLSTSGPRQSNSKELDTRFHILQFKIWHKLPAGWGRGTHEVNPHSSLHAGFHLFSSKRTTLCKSRELP